MLLFSAFCCAATPTPDRTRSASGRCDLKLERKVVMVRRLFWTRLASLRAFYTCGTLRLQGNEAPPQTPQVMRGPSEASLLDPRPRSRPRLSRACAAN